MNVRYWKAEVCSLIPPQCKFLPVLNSSSVWLDRSLKLQGKNKMGICNLELLEVFFLVLLSMAYCLEYQTNVCLKFTCRVKIVATKQSIASAWNLEAWHCCRVAFLTVSNLSNSMHSDFKPCCGTVLPFLFQHEYRCQIQCFWLFYFVDGPAMMGMQPTPNLDPPLAQAPVEQSA